MIYDGPTPVLYDLQRLSRLVEGYPAGIEEFIGTAEAEAIDGDMLTFLRLFPVGAVFDTPGDFTDRCQEVGLIMEEERNTAPEHLRSPQE